MNRNPSWPTLSPTLIYDDAPAAIDWLCRAFGFTLRLRVDGEGGAVMHSELIYEDALLMVSSPKGERPEYVSPRQLGGQVSHSLMLHVADVDAHCARARQAGATILSEPVTKDHGPEYWADRSYGVADPEGHHWWICQRVRNFGEPAR